MSETRFPRALCALLALALALAGVLGTSPALAADGDAAAAYSADQPPVLSSQRALLIEPATGTTLFEQGADERAYPASVTKVMTALVVLENASLDEQVTVEQGDLDEITWESSVAGLKVGETLSVRDLLACLLVPSGNDASYVLARYVGGGDWHAFIDMMNERAAELGCTGTHFVNPCGLHDDDHYSTANDLMAIFREALTHPEFVEIAGSATWDLPATSQNPARTLKNTDELIDPESPVYMADTIVASKTGSTFEGGRSLIVEAERDGRTILGIVLGAPMEDQSNGVPGNFNDMRALLEWGFGAWRTGEVVAAGDVVGSSEVSLSSDGDQVGLRATSAVVATVPTETTLEDLTLGLPWDGALRAPLGDGDELGEATVSLGDRVLGTVTLAPAHAMALSIPAFLIWWLTSDPVHTVLTVVVAVALFVVIGAVSASRRSRRRARVRIGGARPLARAPQPTRLKAPATTPRRSRGLHGSHLRR